MKNNQYLKSMFYLFRYHLLHIHMPLPQSTYKPNLHVWANGKKWSKKWNRIWLILSRIIQNDQVWQLVSSSEWRIGYPEISRKMGFNIGKLNKGFLHFLAKFLAKNTRNSRTRVPDLSLVSIVLKIDI